MPMLQSSTFAMKMNGAFSQNGGKLIFKLKLVTGNLLFIYTKVSVVTFHGISWPSSPSPMSPSSPSSPLGTTLGTHTSSVAVGGSEQPQLPDYEHPPLAETKCNIEQLCDTICKMFYCISDLEHVRGTEKNIRTLLIADT